MKTVLISGGAGFIGSHLARNLLDAGENVIAVDNLLTGSKENLEELLPFDGFRFVEADITTNFENILNVGKVDEIYHLASPASPNAKSKRSYIAFPIETMLVNSVGTYNLLNIAKKHNSKLLFASSSEVYGDPAISPQVESYNGNVSPNGPRSVYDEGKRFGEAMTMGYFRKFGVDTRIVRIFNTYGPKMQVDDGRVVSNFIAQALRKENITIYGDGTQTRSFCFVSDMVSGLREAMGKGEKGEVYNLGNPDERSIADVAKMVIELAGFGNEIVFEDLPEDDPKKRKPDISKANNTFGFAPKVSFEDGLRQTLEYFRSVI